MLINTLISDPATALELGRRLAANTGHRVSLLKRLGEAWSRWFAQA